MGRGEIDKKNVQHKGGATDGLVDRAGTDDDVRNQIPDGDHRADVDLLRLVAEAPPDEAIPRGVGLRRPTHRISKRRDHHDGAVQQSDDGDDGGGGGTERDDRHGAGVGLVPFRDVEGGEEIKHAHQCADGDENDPEVEERMRQQRQVGSHHHVGLSGDDDVIHHDGAGEHHPERDPGNLAREEPGIERRRAGEVEDGDLEEEYPQDQHVDAVERQDPIKPVDGEQVHGLPTREREQERGDATEEEEDNAGDGIELDEALGVEADTEAGRAAHATGRARSGE